MFDLLDISKPVTVNLIDEPTKEFYVNQAEVYLETHSADTTAKKHTKKFEKEVQEAFQIVYKSVLANYERLKDVQLLIVRCPTDVVAEWRDQLLLIEAEFREAQKVLRKKYENDLGHPVHKPDFQTKEYTSQYAQLIFDVCNGGVKSVIGMTHGGVEIKWEDPVQRKSFFTSFVRLGLGANAYTKVLEKQQLAWTDIFV